MKVTRHGDGPSWGVDLEGTTLRIGGLTLDLEALSAPHPVRIHVYAQGQEPTLEPTDWLGAVVELPPRAGRLEMRGGSEEGFPEVVEVVEPLRLELVRVDLFSLPSDPESAGGEG